MARELEQLMVTVLYALPAIQKPIEVFVPKGATVRAAIERSRISEIYPEINLAVNKVGIFGELCSLDDTVHAADRIEIYRPLLIDPKDARRSNAHLNARRDPKRL
ncbi:MAG TPA: RnfH family protein [Gammaproteobacteria bacterium]|nr:RnfH family protein [Gammaproteobacteria bacterium]|tara:strand:- start:272 stop:586 length:315 start_codon:yes stop_codon:yes gene_type:complete